MQRSAHAFVDGVDIGNITCQDYGHTLASERVWWIPETKKMYLYVDAEEFTDAHASAKTDAPQSYFVPYDGPVIHGGGFSF